MAPDTIRMALANMLEDLSGGDFEKFRRQLLDRREEPRIRRNRVEGKNFLDVAEVLVSTFTEPGALDVAVDILKKIDLHNDARSLVEDTRGLISNPDSSGTASPSAGAAGGNTMADDKHFVDKHKLELINRVSNVPPILDELLDRGIIQQESYDRISALPTTQQKMREIYSGALKAGRESKDIFCQILEKYEQYLMADLKKK